MNSAQDIAQPWIYYLASQLQTQINFQPNQNLCTIYLLNAIQCKDSASVFVIHPRQWGQIKKFTNNATMKINIFSEGMLSNGNVIVRWAQKISSFLCLSNIGLCFAPSRTRWSSGDNEGGLRSLPTMVRGCLPFKVDVGSTFLYTIHFMFIQCFQHEKSGAS